MPALRSRTTIAAAAASLVALVAVLAVVSLGGSGGLEDAEAPALPAATRVVQRLHEEGLVMDTEVRDSMIAHANRYQAGETTREAAAARLLAWMDTWERRHPDRAEAARERYASLRPAIEASTPPTTN